MISSSAMLLQVFGLLILSENLLAGSETAVIKDEVTKLWNINVMDSVTKSLSPGSLTEKELSQSDNPMLLARVRWWEDGVSAPDKRDIPTNRNMSSVSRVKRTLKSGDIQNVCPKMMKGEVAGTLVKCKCNGDEILTLEDQCLSYPNGTVIDGKSERRNTSNYNVKISDVKCIGDSYRLLQYGEGQFYLRDRGDVVLKETAGHLAGQRISNYCILHRLGDNGTLTWTMKGCVPVPQVPRCCLHGQAMKDGSCQPADTPRTLKPPITTKPNHDNVEWPNITNFLSPVTCKSKTLKTYPLSYGKSHLISLAKGLMLLWTPPEYLRKHTSVNCPDYCVDGITNHDGSVQYAISLCYSTPDELHKEACSDSPCVRKCCKYEQALHASGYCVRQTNISFNPPTANDVALYKVVTGKPLCLPHQIQMTKEMDIDDRGYLLHNGKTYTPDRYCVDSMIGNVTSVQGTILCPPEASTWDEARLILLPLCYFLSFFFLIITILCYALVPKMLKQGGIHQLCHAISLAIAYFVTFCGIVFFQYLTPGSAVCFTMALVMQFSFLMAFFWLNVMCFELWRTTRNLKTFMVNYREFPTWWFMVYACGIPTLICSVTILIEYFAPDDVPGLIKPAIGVTKCFFKGDWELLVYFYGPIAVLLTCNMVLICLVFYEHRQLMNAHKENIRRLQQNSQQGTVESAKNDIQRTPAKQINDHVSNFTQKIRLFVMFAVCWVAEILSWQIPPPELWALTDLLNSLQGVFLFVIFLGNRNKRKLLKRKFPGVFKASRRILKSARIVKKQLSGRGNDLTTESANESGDDSKSWSSDSSSYKAVVTEVEWVKTNADFENGAINIHPPVNDPSKKHYGATE